MEFFGNLSFMKTGIVFADTISTVSPTYAQEILRSPLGCGMEEVLRHRVDDLFGILNGADYDAWNPATDPFLGENGYDATNFSVGKAACKAALQSDLGLPVRPEVPLLATVGRLADQKGLDLIARVMQQWATEVDAQWVLLGTGDAKYHQVFGKLAAEHPEKIAVRLEFSNALAHQIEAGADMFLMPSQYEPCGLNQLYSLKYGTVPVVRATGGLADTVVPKPWPQKPPPALHSASTARWLWPTPWNALARHLSTNRFGTRWWNEACARTGLGRQAPGTMPRCTMPLGSAHAKRFSATEP